VHSGIQELNKRIKVVASVLNLKGHWAGLAQKRFLYTCCDIGKPCGWPNSSAILIITHSRTVVVLC
jgi:hypothetical protein